MLKRNLFQPIMAILCIALVACTGQKAPMPDERQGASDDFTEQETLPNDILADTPISTSGTALAQQLDDIAAELQAVKSPDMLMRAKSHSPEQLSAIGQELQQLSDEEKTVLQQKAAEVQTLYTQTCQTYEVEAEGIISNLQDLIVQVHKVNSLKAFESFSSGRYGVLKNLDKIHLSTHDTSPRINEIKRLAKELASLVEAKKKQLGIAH